MTAVFEEGNIIGLERRITYIVKVEKIKENLLL